MTLVIDMGARLGQLKTRRDLTCSPASELPNNRIITSFEDPQSIGMTMWDLPPGPDLRN
jgi:hypothetical protein